VLLRLQQQASAAEQRRCCWLAQQVLPTLCCRCLEGLMR
jgi:hypothetical protein